MDKFVAVIAMIGSLILVTNNSRFRNLSGGKAIRLALIWAAIIVALVLLVQASGWQAQS
ncbi:hypothetical protein [Novosphingobium terrae]|uniref:hypothetical protein n=1 Tax=Novosphingobium terrae TaxID=2726189 RepID=UPI001F13F027|nr:hypothetical protein [Novosphingobium terrae]